MAKKRKISKTFSEKLEVLAQEELNDNLYVRIAKKRYLMSMKNDLVQAAEEGYPYRLIALIATEELYEMNIPKTITFKNKENEEITREVKFTPREIKNFIGLKEEE